MTTFAQLSSLQLQPGKGVALVALLCLAIFIASTIFTNIRANRKYKLPNLVPGLPIIGNTHQLPSHNLCLHAEQLAKEYGDM